MRAHACCCLQVTRTCSTYTSSNPCVSRPFWLDVTKTTQCDATGNNACDTVCCSAVSGILLWHAVPVGALNSLLVHRMCSDLATLQLGDDPTSLLQGYPAGATCLDIDGSGSGTASYACPASLNKIYDGTANSTNLVPTASNGHTAVTSDTMAIGLCCKNMVRV